MEAEETVTLKTVAGTYRDGQIELAETPEDLKEMQVLVTFMPKSRALLLSDYGVDDAQAADLRARLRPVEEDWNHPDMDGYDVMQPHPRTGG